VRDLSQGNPDPGLLPPLAPAFAAAAAWADREPVLYGADPLDPELARIARAEFDADGVPDGPLVVTSGALDAIERVLGAHLRPGDAVAVEDPGWASTFDLVPALGLRAAPVGVDEEGPLPDDVRRALEAGARALLVTERAQNPTGAALSASRAAELREVLARHPQTLVIEDDHGYGIVDLPPHPLAGTTRSWAFVRSTAKTYGPDLRLAVVTGDEVTVDRVRGRQRLGPGWVSRLTQRALVELWRGEAVDRAAVSRSYGRRRRSLIAGLGRRGVEAWGRTGMNVWIPVPDETGAVAGLLQEGWAVAPGARFRMNSAPGIRVTVSGLDEAEAASLADTVARVLKAGQARRYV
jgi:DNA-binding transcriptional MocR family regulator